MTAAITPPRRPGSTIVLSGPRAPAERVLHLDGTGARRFDEAAFKLPADAGDVRAVIQREGAR
jgi:hypothetical protein